MPDMEGVLADAKGNLQSQKGIREILGEILQPESVDLNPATTIIILAAWEVLQGKSQTGRRLMNSTRQKAKMTLVIQRT
jgi:hypothetical protein